MSNKPNRRPPSRVAAARAASTSSSSRTWWIVGGVAIVVVLALVIAIVATRSNDSASNVTIKGGGTVVPAGELTYGDVVVNGTALAAQPDGATTDPAVGKHAPTLTGEQFSGAALTVPAAGKPAVVMFVAHWCPHCQKEVPLIGAWLRDNGLPQDVNLYTVATSSSDQSPNFPPSDWLHREGWPVPTIADDSTGRAATAYGVGGFPYFVVLDVNGNVVQRTSGELPIEQFQALLDAARRSPTTGSTAPVGTTR